MATPAKRKRCEIPAALKSRICRLKEQYPKWTLQKLTEEIRREEGVEIGRSTIGDILRDREKWLAVKEGDRSTRRRQPKFTQLEEALFLWLADMAAHSETITDQMILLKATEFGQELGIRKCAYSKGWLHRFKTRRGISRQWLESRTPNFDLEEASDSHHALQELIASYPLQDVFTINETALFYNLGPGQVLDVKVIINFSHSQV